MDLFHSNARVYIDMQIGIYGFIKNQQSVVDENPLKANHGRQTDMCKYIFATL